MKRIHFSLLGLLGLLIQVSAQTYLTPSEGYKSAYFFPEYASVSAFDITDAYLYIHDGDTIRKLDMDSGDELASFGTPDDYIATHYASFLTLSPDGSEAWAGYTSDGNVDDRIYRVDLGTGSWELAARLPGNFKLVYWNDSLLVSGLNSTDWQAPNSVLVLDTTGADQHRKIIEIGGSNSGLAVDSDGNLFGGTAIIGGLNGLYRWDSAVVAQIISNPGSDTLTREDAVQLAGLPMGLADCAVDQGGNLVFNMNQFGSAQVMARWNGTTGNGYNFDTLSVATGEYDWLWFIRSQGDFTLQEMNNRILTFSFGQPLAELHTMDYPPFVKSPVPDLNMMVERSDTAIDISQVFTDPDDPDSLITKTVVYNSDTVVVHAIIEGDSLRIHHEPHIALKSAYMPVELVLEGRSHNLAVTDTLLVNVEFISGVEAGLRNQIRVYPNPSKGRFLVRDSGLQPLIVEVYDLTGKEIYSESEFRPGSVIDLGSMTTGVYILKLIRGSMNITQLIYKQ